MKELQNKDLNFLQASSGKKKEIKKSSGRKPLILLFPVILLAVGLGYWGYLQWQKIGYENDKEKYSNALSDMTSSSEYQEIGELDKKISELETDIAPARAARDAIDSYPDIAESVFKQITKAAQGKITILYYNYASTDGMLTFSCRTNDVTEITAFVGRLRTADIFSAIKYSGYSVYGDSNSSGTTPQNKIYQFEIGANLKAKDVAANDN